LQPKTTENLVSQKAIFTTENAKNRV